MDKLFELAEEEIKLEKNIKHNIEAVVDRLVIKEGIEGRLSDSIETALKLAEGLVIINVIGEEDILFSEKFSCPDCGISIDELAPRLFSFNTPYGKCDKCDVLGTLIELDPDLIIPNKDLSIMEGAIATWGEGRLKEDSWTFAILTALSKEYDIYAPKRFPKQGRFSDTDIVHYDRVAKAEEIVFDDDLISMLCETALKVQNQENTTLPILKKQYNDTLKSIDNLLNAIQQGILTTNEEIQDATLRTIKEAQRMNKLIKEMLDLSRLENNVQTVLEKVSINKLIGDCLGELKPLIESKNIEVITNLEEISIEASQSDLYKLIKNIIDNSVAYNNQNGKLIIELSKNKLTISDTGVGISKEDLEHIFERFYRVDKARSRESSGTGLGLSIVKHICILYGYKINVESQLGKGSTFTIKFK